MYFRQTCRYFRESCCTAPGRPNRHRHNIYLNTNTSCSAPPYRHLPTPPNYCWSPARTSNATAPTGTRHHKKNFHCQFIFVIVVTHILWFLLIRGKENGFLERPPAALEPPAKRICTISPAPRHSPAHPLQLPTQMHPTPPPLQHYALDDVTTPHLYREPHRLLDLRDLKDRARLPGTNGSYREEPVDHRLTEREWAEEWRHLDHVRLDSFFKWCSLQKFSDVEGAFFCWQVLNCIVDMVEKTRRSVSVLRRCQESDREELNYWRRRSGPHDECKTTAAPGGVTFNKTHSPLSTDSVHTGEFHIQYEE